MLFVLCKENNYYEKTTINDINEILSKATVTEQKNETHKPELRNLRNAIAHGNIEPLENDLFSFINEGKNCDDKEYKLVFTLTAQSLTEIMNLAIKDLETKMQLNSIN